MKDSKWPLVAVTGFLEPVFEMVVLQKPMRPNRNTYRLHDHGYRAELHNFIDANAGGRVGSEFLLPKRCAVGTAEVFDGEHLAHDEPCVSPRQRGVVN